MVIARHCARRAQVLRTRLAAGRSSRVSYSISNCACPSSQVAMCMVWFSSLVHVARTQAAEAAAAAAEQASRQAAEPEPEGPGTRVRMRRH